MNRPLPTCDDTVGPYFPPHFADAQGALDLFRPRTGLNAGAIGSPIVLKVRLLDVDGRLANGALMEVWTANSKGHLRVPGSELALADDPFFQGYGRLHSTDGNFEVRLAMPGATVVGGTRRAPCVTLTIFSDGISRIVTQIFFEGRPENDADPVLAALPSQLRPRLIARKELKSAMGEVFAVDIKLRGDDETPFFDDELSTGLE